MVIAKKLSISPCQPRKPSNLNRFHKYDGNIIGGFILGSGMALTGACPGTVLVQIATGTSSGPLVFVGAVLGGMLWSRFGYCVKCKDSTASGSNKRDSSCTEDESTVYASTRISESQAAFIYNIFCYILVISASYLAPHASGSPHLNPIVGGLIIGAAQAASLVITGSAIGVSTGYETIGDYINRFIGLSTNTDAPLPPSNPVVFILGMMGGSWVLGKVLAVRVIEETVDISWARALIGGAALIIGARTAGGCTSGHGISGMSTLSKSSFLTVGSMFIGGIAISALLK